LLLCKETAILNAAVLPELVSRVMAFDRTCEFTPSESGGMDRRAVRAVPLRGADHPRGGELAMARDGRLPVILFTTPAGPRRDG
jgi:hypothetical protein